MSGDYAASASGVPDADLHLSLLRKMQAQLTRMETTNTNNNATVCEMISRLHILERGSSTGKKGTSANKDVSHGLCICADDTPELQADKLLKLFKATETRALVKEQWTQLILLGIAQDKPEITPKQAVELRATRGGRAEV